MRNVAFFFFFGSDFYWFLLICLIFSGSSDTACYFRNQEQRPRSTSKWKCKVISLQAVKSKQQIPSFFFKHSVSVFSPLEHVNTQREDYIFLTKKSTCLFIFIQTYFFFYFSLVFDDFYPHSLNLSFSDAFLIDFLLICFIWFRERPPGTTRIRSHSFSRDLNKHYVPNTEFSF